MALSRIGYANYASFPATGAANIIYVDLSNGNEYLWSNGYVAYTGTLVGVRTAYKTAAWFAANPTLLLGQGQRVDKEQSGLYKLGDGVTELQNLTWLGVAQAGGGIWGNITGTLTNQTDLVNYVAAAVLPYVPYTGATSDLNLGSKIVIANNAVFKKTSTVSSGATTVLTIGSTRIQTLTGTQNHTFQLEDATLLNEGWTHEFNNNSTGILTVTDKGTNVLLQIQAGGYARVSCDSILTANGTWDYHFILPSNIVSGTNIFATPGSLYVGATTSNISAAKVQVTPGNNTHGLSVYASGSDDTYFGLGVYNAGISNWTFNVQKGGGIGQLGSQNNLFGTSGVTTFGSTIHGESKVNCLQANQHGFAAIVDGTDDTYYGLGIYSTATAGWKYAVTKAGTVIAGTWNATKISEAYGGTNQTTYTTGDILYASAANTLSKLAASTSGYVLTSNGAGTAPSWQAASGGGYSIEFCSDTGLPTPANGSAWYFGSISPSGATATPGIRSMPIAKSGTVDQVGIWIRNTTNAGAADQATLYFAIYDSSGASISTTQIITGITFNSVNNHSHVSASGLGIAVTAGQCCEIKIVFPTWTSTVPSNIFFSAVAVIR